MTRVAAIDCGTHSIRLLVADIDAAAGTLVDVDRRMTIVRLGEGVDRSGRLSDAALDRTIAALSVYSRRIRELDVERVRMVATSASRDASNRDVFVERVVDVLGVPPEVVTGDEEARLSFGGATKDLPADGAPYLVVDIGGGSTEFVLGERTVRAALSVDIGCVRMTERHLLDDPPTRAQIDAAGADIDAAIDSASAVVPFGEARTLVGLAGSVTTVAAATMDLSRYDPVRIHRSVLPADGVVAAAERLLSMSRTDRSALPYLHPGRVDVIGAGALVWAQVIRRVGLATVVTSEHDILDGIAWSLVPAG